MKFTRQELIELTLPDGGSFGCEGLPDAYAFCEDIAKSHYENFPVGSVLIPKHLRKYFFSVYAFARIADDIADEIKGAPEEKIKILKDFLANIHNPDFEGAGQGKKLNPVFRALADTMKVKEIPILPFAKLVQAFIWDSNFRHPESIDNLEEYCRHSANPVGELVLRIFGIYNEKTAFFSDKICTGLQLVNFWQDFSRDLKVSRCYIPNVSLNKYGISADDIFKTDLLSKAKLDKLEILLEELYKLTGEYFREGSQLLSQIPFFRLRAELAVTIEGGMKILEETKKLGLQIFRKRPSLGKTDLLKILLRAVIRHRFLLK